MVEKEKLGHKKAERGRQAESAYTPTLATTVAEITTVS
jgi:hypothetical protein